MQKKIDEEIDDHKLMYDKVKDLERKVIAEMAHDMTSARLAYRTLYEDAESDNKGKREMAQSALQFLRENSLIREDEFEAGQVEQYLMEAVKDADELDRLYQHEFFRPFIEKKYAAVSMANELVRQQYNNTKTLYRGTTLKELDNMLDHEFIGGGQPSRRTFISMSPNQTSASQFSGGVVIEYNKKEIDKHIMFPGYGLERTRVDNIAEPEGTSFMHEQEVRVSCNDVPVKTQKMKIIISKSIIMMAGYHNKEPS